jgi:uncharacterized membrane protein YhaH (DUF805 family)
MGAIMNFVDSIKTCFAKYADFNGRAKRPEFWWYTLFIFLVSIALSVLTHHNQSVSGLFSLATLLPSLAVGARRLHDTDRSGWWQLLWILPVIGWIIMIVFQATAGQAGDNRFGSPPAN